MTSPAHPAGILGHLRKLASHSAIYGSADVASQLINLLLTPLFVVYLSTTDIGVIALLMLLSATTRLVFRMGLDGGFLRIYYDQKDDASRADLVRTVAVFAVMVGTGLYGALALAGSAVAAWLIPDVAASGTLVRFALADVAIGNLLFVPLHLLRIEGQARRVAVLLVLRNGLNTGLKVLLVVTGFGVAGVLVSDVLGTLFLALALLPFTLTRARGRWRSDLLRPVLAFGLPKAPHGFMVQILNLADRKILEGFAGLPVVGIYDKGYTLGAGVKFALSAFEPAWQPFVFSRIGQTDARETLARVATYAWLAFVSFGLALAMFGRELLVTLTFTNASFWPGAAIVPPIVLAYLLHGVFLLTSIGVGIEKRARYYPVITGIAAATNLAANFALIPRFGMMGAAWATVASYAVMAGIGWAISHRLYPIPFETRRVARVSAAALLVFLASRWAPEALLAAIVVKVLLLVAFPLLLWLMGFCSPKERDMLRRALTRRP